MGRIQMPSLTYPKGVKIIVITIIIIIVIIIIILIIITIIKNNDSKTEAKVYSMLTNMYWWWLFYLQNWSVKSFGFQDIFYACIKNWFVITERIS